MKQECNCQCHCEPYRCRLENFSLHDKTCEHCTPQQTESWEEKPIPEGIWKEMLPAMAEIKAEEITDSDTFSKFARELMQKMIPIIDLNFLEKEALKKEIEGMRSDNDSCPEGGKHEMEEQPTDTGFESFCSKCFTYRAAILGRDNGLSKVLELLK